MWNEEETKKKLEFLARTTENIKIWTAFLVVVFRFQWIVDERQKKISAMQFEGKNTKNQIQTNHILIKLCPSFLIFKKSQLQPLQL